MKPAIDTRVPSAAVGGGAPVVGDLTGEGDIPVPHRLAIIYLMLPVSIWLLAGSSGGSAFRAAPMNDNDIILYVRERENVDVTALFDHAKG